MNTILILSVDTVGRDQLMSHIKKTDTPVEVIAVDNLMSAYVAAEEQHISLAIIEEEFLQLPEFQPMKKLFKALEVSCVLYSKDSSDRRREGMPVIHRPDSIDTYISALGKSRTIKPVSHPEQSDDQRAKNKSVILIGSSTGGIDALCKILSSFPKNCPPTVIVQHTGTGFGQGLVDMCRQVCPADVVSAGHGWMLEAGKVCIVAGQRHHLELSAAKPTHTLLREGPPVSGHTPSVDKLFHSAVPMGKQVVAALLTRMGQDGAEGLLALRKAGAATFAQDEKTSVVYGMPRAAWEIGAAQRRVPLHRMAAALLGASKF